MSSGYYNEKVLAKFDAALKEAKTEVSAILSRGEIPQVKFSASNSKMGAVASVSLLPFLTCPSCCKGTCGAACYAAKLANLRPNVLKAYAWNTAIAMTCRDVYFAQIDDFCKGIRYFRFHVSGDNTNSAYFDDVVSVVINNPKTEFLMFTKRFDIVNKWIDVSGKLPENLHVLFSGWSNLKPNNPYKLPETTVYEHEEEFREEWKTCGGNCFNCACRGLGCWQASSGDVIAFRKH